MRPAPRRPGDARDRDVRHLEADDLEDAVEIASLHPAARLGEEVGFAVEVRPIEFLARPGE